MSVEQESYVEIGEAEQKRLYKDETKDDQMPDWVNPPKVSDLKADYQEALPSHQVQKTKIRKWLDHLNLEGSAKNKYRPGRSSAAPRLIRKQAEWRYPSLSEPFLSTDELFNVAPVTFEDKEGAVQNELVLNYQFNHKINKTRLINEMVRTAVDEGTVILRTGWDYEEEIIEVEQPVMIQQPITDPMMLAQAAAQGLPPYIEVPTGEVEIVEETRVIRNCPTVEVVDNGDLIVDPTCRGDIDKANFAIYAFETNLSELKKDGKYTNLDKIKVENSSLLGEDDHVVESDDPSFTFKDKPRQKFMAYEYWGYWDYNKTGIVEPFVATYVGNTMIRMEENPFPDKKIPFTLAHLLFKRGSTYGEPDGELLMDNQKIVGAVTRGMIDIMGRSANGQMAIRKDALDVVNRRKFERGQDYEFNANVDPRQAFHMHTYPEIPRSAHEMLQVQNQDAESLTGVKAFTSGLSGQALGTTATGIRGALDASSKRELDILRRLATALVEVGHKIVAMNAEFLSDEEIIRVTNEEFVSIKREALAGEFDLKLSISTAEADNEKAQELSFMLQTMGNSMDFGMSQLILSDIARLRKMPDLAKRIMEFQPQPDPAEEQKKALEIELLKAQIHSEQVKAMENQVDMELKRAKTRALDSDSDLKDLDFLHKESGEDVRRKIEEKDFDRRTQLDLKAADSMLKGEEQPKAQ